MYMNFWSTYAKNTATYRLVDLNSTWRNKTRSTSPETDIIHVFNAAKRYDDLTFIHSRLHRARVCMEFFERMIKNQNTTASWIVIIARGNNKIHKTNKQYTRRVRSDLHSCLAYKWRTWYFSLQTEHRYSTNDNLFDLRLYLFGVETRWRLFSGKTQYELKANRNTLMFHHCSFNKYMQRFMSVFLCACNVFLRFI